MTASEYKARRDANLCTGNLSCPGTPKGALCDTHRSIASAASRKYGKTVYLEKKLAGTCVLTGCKEDATDDSVICAKHQKERSDREKTPAMLAQGRARHAQVRARRLAKKRCAGCGGERLKTKSLGRRCLAKLRKRYAARKAERVAAAERLAASTPCSKCARLDCREQRCLVVAPLPPLRIEQFMVGGQHALEMA